MFVIIIRPSGVSTIAVERVEKRGGAKRESAILKKIGKNGDIVRVGRVWITRGNPYPRGLHKTKSNIS